MSRDVGLVAWSLRQNTLRGEFVTLCLALFACPVGQCLPRCVPEPARRGGPVLAQFCARACTGSWE